MQDHSSSTLVRRFHEPVVSRVVVLALLFSAAAIVETRQLLSLRDPEIWRHLQAGGWILHHASWPRTGLFSQAANLPWMDFSWGYDVLAAAAYRILALRALPALLMTFRVALAAIAFLLAGGRRGNFWSALALSLVVQYLLAGLGPTPAFASVLLFGMELFFLLECRGFGDLRFLFILPVLFLVWANLDLGYVYGIGLYVLFLASLAVEKMSRVANWQWIEKPAAVIPLGTAALTGCACGIASIVNPYGYQGYAAFFANQFSGANRYLPGYTAMSFHQPRDYVLLLLTMAAFLWLGIRRSRDLFRLSVLIVCAMLAYHAQRESWLVALAAVALIGGAISQSSEKIVDEHGLHWNKGTLTTAGAAIAMVFLAFAILVPRGRGELMAKIAESFPVRACDAIRQRHLSTPLFNSYAWGGFLTWYLPEYPVAIDGRQGLYPEEEEIAYFKVMNAEEPYQFYPQMRLARTLLLDKQNVMAEALRGLPGFQTVYEDGISIVLLQTEKQ